MKKLALIPLAVCAGVLFAGSPAQASKPYYEVTSERAVTRGVTYHTSKRVVEGGLLDVYVMKVPTDDPYLTLAPVSSTTEYGLKEPTSKLLADNGALAGVNGDYFGMAGAHSIPLGTEIDGKKQSVTEGSNNGKIENATFFISDTGTPFIYYMQTNITFLNNGTENIPVASINKVVDLTFPTIFTYDYFKDTAQIDARTKNTVKIVVENGLIQRITQKGETVSVPQNGFIVGMGADYYEKYKDKVAVGQSASYYILANVDISKVKAAISGAGKILDNGILSTTGAVISGRQPRTGIGISADGKTVILMVVDGRTHSIGATPAEMAELMLEYGAYNAMHLDGGGSSTMVVPDASLNAPAVVNTLSDSVQRKVINALGLFDSSPVGEITSIEIVAEQDVVVTGMPSKIAVYGLDAYLHRIDLPQGHLSLHCPTATFFDGYIIPSVSGVNEITAEFMGLKASKSVRSIEIAELRPNAPAISTIVGGEVPIAFTGAGKSGFSVLIDTSAVKCEVYPPELGVVENGVFRSMGLGLGYIKCSFGDIRAYIEVDATMEPLVIDMLEGPTQISFVGYPNTVTGSAAYAQDVKTIGGASVRLDYSFKSYGDTQAAYINFDIPAQTTYNAKGFRISVYGDGSGHWLRGRIKDANGVTYTVDFIRNIDFTGWKDLDITVPAGAAYPVTLDRIYVASLYQGFDSSHTIYIDNLRGFYSQYEKFTKPETPQPTRAKDDMAGALQPGGYDITFAGGLHGYSGDKPANYDDSRKKAIAALKKGSKAAVYGGVSDISAETGMLTYMHDGKYAAYTVNDLTIIKMFGSEGGFAATDATQWSRIKNDIASSFTKNIVIHADINPLNFKYSQEYDLFHGLLKEYAAKGKNIFVVSYQGAFTTTSLREGVRYINLGGLYDEEGLNNKFGILRFRINGNDIRYDLEYVFQ